MCATAETDLCETRHSVTVKWLFSYPFSAVVTRVTVIVMSLILRLCYYLAAVRHLIAIAINYKQKLAATENLIFKKQGKNEMHQGANDLQTSSTAY